MPDRTERRGRFPALPWLAGLFVLLLFGMPMLRPVFAWAFPGVTPALYERESFVTLFLSHAGLVAASGAASALVGVAVAIAVTRGAGREFRPIVDTVAVIGQTFPPAAVLALAVPAVGFGALPTLIALTLYGLLPVVENAIAGIDAVPADVKEVARGMGLSPLQMLYRVELPLAAAAILSGIRISVTVAIGTATIGSTVGALSLGTPIIGGLYGEKLPWVIQGALLVGLFAIVVDLAFERLVRRVTRYRQAGDGAS